MTLRRRIAGLLSRPFAPEEATVEVAARYAPEVDGEPDPGEVVWAWVPYEDDPRQGKDRPVLLLDTDDAGTGWTGLMLSSQDHDRDAADEARHGRHWMDVGTGGWDPQRRPSEVRLDRLLHLERGAVRREGAALDPTVFADVVAAVRGLDR
ncbi:type II toxin-antitoxin system PemK/MazF family toxin [Nocardioides sp.]|uniref:type II toxin-antitoxin system PemK/MazF family toxin n=1 Tax=Nocardioides sp. TaxID=35761 RepID=UPI00261C3F48|nr:type II toxin-antitoxin system PemK/MazF family toxin [Nocardioides sp.]MCW2738374.1 type toxin-antitoxin system PemK/MazF family toxin [Nocardioides sp.]